MRADLQVKRQAAERKEKVDNLPHSVPLQVVERVRRRVHYTGRAKIQDTFSEEIYIVVRAPAISGGPYVINRVTGDNTILRVTASGLKRCEGKVIEKVNDFILGLREQPDVTEENSESREGILLTPG